MVWIDVLVGVLVIEVYLILEEVDYLQLDVDLFIIVSVIKVVKVVLDILVLYNEFFFKS